VVFAAGTSIIFVQRSEPRKLRIAPARLSRLRLLL
jgi:hypothetical protein